MQGSNTMYLILIISFLRIKNNITDSSKGYLLYYNTNDNNRKPILVPFLCSHFLSYRPLSISDRGERTALYCAAMSGIFSLSRHIEY
jgi:hypothetical protein